MTGPVEEGASVPTVFLSFSQAQYLQDLLGSLKPVKVRLSQRPQPKPVSAGFMWVWGIFAVVSGMCEWKSIR